MCLDAPRVEVSPRVKVAFLCPRCCVPVAVKASLAAVAVLPTLSANDNIKKLYNYYIITLFKTRY